MKLENRTGKVFLRQIGLKSLAHSG